jgi:hypothetical protein
LWVWFGAAQRDEALEQRQELGVVGVAVSIFVGSGELVAFCWCVVMIVVSAVL